MDWADRILRGAPNKEELAAFIEIHGVQCQFGRKFVGDRFVALQPGELKVHLVLQHLEALLQTQCIGIGVAKLGDLAIDSAKLKAGKLNEAEVNQDTQDVKQHCRAQAAHP